MSPNLTLQTLEPKNDEIAERPWTPSYSVFSLPGASTKAEGSSHEEVILSFVVPTRVLTM